MTNPVGTPSARTSTLSRVSALVGEILERRAKAPRSIGPDQSLTDVGLSSLDMVNLMLSIESAFDVFIPPDLIKPSSFRSIASVSLLVDSLQGAESPEGRA